VYSHSDRDPGHYLLFEPARDRWQPLGHVRPSIDPGRMAAKSLHRIKARDGAELPLWITRPARPEGAPPAPAVVLVHGGPHVRGGYREWSAEAQFLASRGYVVIEPEFRGSAGYGAAHFRAGWKQWGHKMQDDLSDALQFAVAQGLVEAGRACIMGASYGGYAALMGVVKDPDQYRCAVATAAVSDPRFLYEFHWSDVSYESLWYALPWTLGDPKKDEALLIAASPLVHAARIKAPVLLVHGGKDLRVPIQSGERMAEAMRKAGKAVEFVVYPDEGHSFRHDANRFDYYRRVEKFLAQHLK
jgi:dipeptidyl aminopeptidase/acylaminoacyl peptidase